ncbi:MFS transporter [Streptomyces sp. SID8361]|uniref:MFS transporter n=1 Tax=Streptomyces sp. MnatMP-M27 TaxID=1839768 RepID=UPI00081F359E|nr:MFS transporter [Streptomyces sp. MnatMP-M27]MYU16114.1 MFS transporter [Streptomyces sp. SID8361]SCG10673.1 Sugar phosphate permease [Streptomyces sp. MnatMP-M27]
MTMETTPTPVVASAEDPRRDTVYRKIKWRILPLLVVCYVVAFVDRSNIGFAKLEFAGPLGFSDAVFGLGASLFYLGYVLFEVPSNLMLHKVGARKTFLRIMIPWGLASAVTAFMTTPAHFYTVRFLLGVFEAGFFPGVLLYLSFWIPAERRASVNALFLSAMAISGIVGGPVSGAIIDAMDGIGGMDGWQWVFLVEGLPACALGFVAYFVLSDGPESASWLSPDDRRLVVADLERGRPTGAKVPHSYGAALRSRRFWGLAALGFGIMTSTSGLFLWLPTILKDSGSLGVGQVGLVSAIPFVLAVVAQYLNARHSDRTQERCMHAGVFAVAGTVGWLLLPLVAQQTWPALAVLSLIAVGTMGAMGPFWAMPAALLTGTAAAGGIATITAFAGIGNLVTPSVTGWLSSTTGTQSYNQLLYGAVLGIGTLLMFLLVRPARIAGTARPLRVPTV